MALHPSPLTRAPGFLLPDQKGRARSLIEFMERGPLLLAFHRGTSCPNCRHRFAELAQDFPAYAARGLQVIAIVTQSRESMRRYVEEKGLPFDVLIDERRDVVRAYGVWHRAGIFTWNNARPAAFLIDADGSIRASWIGSNQTQFPSRDEILEKIG